MSEQAVSTLPEYTAIADHLWHLTDGHWHDGCRWCLQRRVKGGDGLSAKERDLYEQGRREEAAALAEARERWLAEKQPSHLWPCGCLKNSAGAHRAGCPDHPEGVRG